jgi:hypothetical protein
MKATKTIYSILIIFAIASVSHAQFFLGVQAGLAGSAFEDDVTEALSDKSATGIPVGVAFGIDALPLIDVGVEYNMLVSPFKFEQEVLGETATISISQNMVGAFARVYLPMVIIDPYVRGGVAYYMGSYEFELAGETATDDFKGSVGFNAGVGVSALFGLYGEFVFHIVSRELDVENPTSLGYNSWALTVGYTFDL